MSKVVVIGGGWAGSAAAIAARKQGAEVIVIERMEMLLGTGLVGGIMRNNGRYTATEEAIAMGGGDLFQITDRVSRHHNIEFPGHKHANLYDISLVEPAVKKHLLDLGIEVRLTARAVNAEKDENGNITAVILDEDKEKITGDVFVEATGTAGPMANCIKYGNGCAMCVIRCHSYGNRVSIAGKLGIEEMVGRKGDGSIGAMSGSCKIFKESLSPEIQEELNTKGVAVVPIPEELQKGEDSLSSKACQQYALAEYAANVILLDTGHAKLMSPFFPLEALRMIPGFENARYEDPYAGDMGNSMRYMALSPRDNALKVQGLNNLFCGGEKAGLLVGHTEAIVTGTLAGHNAVRQAEGKELLELSRETSIGEAIAYVNEEMQTEPGRSKKYTFSGSVLFDHLKEKGFYTTDKEEIRKRIEKVSLTDIFSKKID